MPTNAAILGQLAVALDLDTKRFEQGLSETYRQLEGFDKKQAAAMGKRSMAGLSALGAAIVAVGAASIKAASDFEQYAVSFEVMTGSAEKGLMLLNSMRDFANVTPFTTDDIAQAGKVLLQFGVSLDEVMPTLKVLGDVSGGNSEKLNSLVLAFGQMSSTGRLVGQDLLQMINAGFNPLQEISKRTGKSMSELKDEMEKGAITSGMVKQAFIDATSEGGRFFGMMEKQSKTVQGTWSTMADTWGKVAQRLGETLEPLTKGFINFFTAMGNGANEALTNALLLFEGGKLKLALTEYENLKKKADESKKADDIVNARMKLAEANVIGDRINKLLGKGDKLSTDASKIDTKSGSVKIDDKKKGKTAEQLQKEALQRAEKNLENSLNKQLALNDYTEQETLKLKIEYAGKKIKIEEKYKGDVEGAIVEQLELQKQLNRQILEDKKKTIQDETEYELSSAEWSIAGEARIREESLRRQRDLYKQATREWIELDKQYQAAVKETNKAIYDDKKALFEQEQEWITRIQQAEIDLERKRADEQYGIWQDYYSNLGRLSGENLSAMIKGTQSFGETTMKILGQMLEAELKAIALQAIAQNFDRGDGELDFAGVALKALVSSFTLFDNGGIVKGTPAEHLMTIQQGGEMNLNHAQQQNLWDIVNGKKGAGNGQPIIVSNQFNVKTLDGKQAADVILEQKQLIQKMVAEGIKNNHGGLRSTVRSVS